MFARTLLSLVVGWITAGAGIFLAQKNLDRSQMDAAAGVAVVVGLIAIVATWRLTRSWKSRQATEAELAQGFTAHLSANYLAFMILIGIPSFGILTLLFWLIARPFPRLLDADGLTLRNGRRLLWRDITGIKEIQLRLAGVPIGKRWHLTDGSATTTLSSAALREGQSVVEFASRRLGGALSNQ